MQTTPPNTQNVLQLKILRKLVECGSAISELLQFNVYFTLKPISQPKIEYTTEMRLYFHGTYY